jgi:muscarinic acetylcholine receptor M3
LLIWVTWVYGYPYIEGQRTVPDHECYIQIIETYITVGTAIIVFYIPVTIMCILYWRIWTERAKRQKDHLNLQTGNEDSSNCR